jgi:hypothetical protein
LASSIEVAQYPLIADEGDGQLGLDIDLAGGLQIRDFLGDRFPATSLPRRIRPTVGAVVDK